MTGIIDIYIFGALTGLLTEGQEFLVAPLPAPVLLCHTSGPLTLKLGKELCGLAHVHLSNCPSGKGEMFTDACSCNVYHLT